MARENTEDHMTYDALDLDQFVAETTSAPEWRQRPAAENLPAEGPVLAHGEVREGRLDTRQRLAEREVLELHVELVVDSAEPLAHHIDACGVLDDPPEAGDLGYIVRRCVKVSTRTKRGEYLPHTRERDAGEVL
jgi:hypothetical protein